MRGYETCSSPVRAAVLAGPARGTGAGPATARIGGTDTEPPARPAAATVAVLPLQGRDSGVCVCQNLIASARALVRLSNEELFALPGELRARTRDALVGVWQVLDLVQRLDDVEAPDWEDLTLEWHDPLEARPPSPTCGQREEGYQRSGAWAAPWNRIFS